MNPFSIVSSIGFGLISKVFGNKEDRDKANSQLLEMQQNGDLAKYEAQLHILIAEAKSSDKWTSRARPGFLYVMYIFILFSIPIGLLNSAHPEFVKQIISGMQMWLSAIPAYMWSVFGIGFTGYTISRSYDKGKILDSRRL